jgi:hypothetical protein
MVKKSAKKAMAKSANKPAKAKGIQQPTAASADLTKQTPAPSLEAISVHPRFAHAILSMKRLTDEEFAEVKAMAAAHDEAIVASTGCWISDSGGQQHCVNLSPAACTNKGGISVPIKCPNA